MGPCYDGSNHKYPYSGDGTSGTKYLDHAWNDVSHSRQHWSFAQLKVTQTVYDENDDLIGGTGNDICGAARNRWALSPGASVAKSVPTPEGCQTYVDTHETGHNFLANHNEDAGNCHYVMRVDNAWPLDCRYNVFSTNSKNEINSCVSTYGTNCPRSNTG